MPTALPPPTSSSVIAVLRSDLRFQRKVPVIWGVSLGATCALISAMWPSISDAIGAAIKGYPEAIKQAFSIRELSNVNQYVDVEMLSFIVPFALAFFAIRSSTRAMVWAEEHGHLDSLLSLPLSRRVLVFGSFLATAILLAVNLLIMWGMTLGMAELVGAHASPSALAAGFGNVFPLSMAFAGFAVLLAGVLHRSAAVTGIASGTLVAMYVVDLVGKISPDLHDLRIASAFRWYGSAVQDGFSWVHALALTGVGVLLAVLGAELFQRRDVL